MSFKNTPWIAAMAVVIGFGTTAEAVPYASGLRDLGGGDFEFVLNMDADNVTVDFDGGASSADLGALAAGRHTFSLGSASAFDIKVSNTAPTGFTKISDDANLFNNYWRPSGLAVNTIPTSPFFGTIYVNNSQGDTTASGRTTGNGVYALTADQIGVDLVSGAALADVNDVTQAKAPGISLSTSTSSFYRIALDDGGNLIAGDWSDDTGGIKYLSPDLTFGGPLLRQEGGFDPIEKVAFSDDSDEFGALPLHGSIVGEPVVSGTLGVDLVVSAMDEDLDADLSIPGDDGNNVWTWNVGSAAPTGAGASRPVNFAGAPSLTIDAGAITSGANGALGAVTGQDSEGNPVFLNLNIGVSANAQYNAAFDKWYLSGARFDGNESSLVIIDGSETGKAADAQVNAAWASLQYSIDNDLDGYPDQEDPPGSEIDDVFRNTTSVAFSQDGSTMYLHRRFINGAIDPNPYLGTDNNGPEEANLGGAILAIPLDENGLPDIVIDDAGTPGDTSDDFFSNVVGIETVSNDAFQANAETDVDIAGNVYVTSNNSELIEIFSPGGSFVTTTSNNASLTGGAFAIEELGVMLAEGDFNADGQVDNADLNLLLNNWGAASVPGDWVNSFTANPGVNNDELNALLNTWGSGISSVPEPTTLLLAAVGCLIGRRRRG